MFPVILVDPCSSFILSSIFLVFLIFLVLTEKIIEIVGKRFHNIFKWCRVISNVLQCVYGNCGIDSFLSFIYIYEKKTYYISIYIDIYIDKIHIRDMILFFLLFFGKCRMWQVFRLQHTNDITMISMPFFSTSTNPDDVIFPIICILYFLPYSNHSIPLMMPLEYHCRPLILPISKRKAAQFSDTFS